MRSGWLVAYIPFVVLLALVAFAFWPRDGDGDAFFFWYAGHVVVTDRSPYDPNAWGAAGRFGGVAANVVSMCSPTVYEPTCLWKYPPTTAFLFAPFALLDVRSGLSALAMFMFVATAASVVAASQWMRARSPLTLAVFLCACVVSHPFVFEVHATHFEGLGVIGIVMVAIGLATRRTAPIVLGAALLSLKPNLYAGLAVVVLAVLVARREWRTVAWTVGVIGAANLLALLLYPEAIGALLAGAGPISTVGWATTWAFASGILPAPILGIVVVYAVAAAAFALAVRFAPAERRDDVLVAGGAAVGLALSPYVHPYDLLVLIPAFAIALVLSERVGQPGRGILLVAIAGALAAGTWLAVAGSDLVPALPGAMAVVALALLAFTAWAARSRSAPLTGIGA